MANWVYTQVVLEGKTEDLETIFLKLKYSKYIDYEDGDENWTGRALYSEGETPENNFSEFLTNINEKEIEYGILRYDVKTKWAFKDQLFKRLKANYNIEIYLMGMEESDAFVISNDIGCKYFNIDNFKVRGCAGEDGDFKLHKELALAKKTSTFPELDEEVDRIQETIWDNADDLDISEDELRKIFNIDESIVGIKQINEYLNECGYGLNIMEVEVIEL